MSDANLILITGALLVAGLVATIVAGRLRVPGLVLFLGLGMAIGSDGTGWIEFGGDAGDYELARTIGIIALALILFEGGLAVGFSEIRPVLGVSAALATAGTVLTAVVTGLAASWLLGLSTLEGLLLGSIISATDSAAIFGLLRDSSLRPRIGRTLEGESGVNDPVAILLVVGLIDWIQLPDYGLGDMVLLFIEELGIGLAVGLAVGWLAVKGLRRVSLGAESGYAIGTIGAAAVAYGAADSLEGSGFLAVYLAGLYLGSVPIPAKRAVTLFHQGLAQVSQVTLFVVLGLLVFPSQLGDVAVEGTLLALILMFVARPLSTALCAAPFGFAVREQAVLAWAGLRGAVPVVLATFPVIDGVPESLDFFNIVFFAVLLSTLLQGATFEPFAKSVGVTEAQGPQLPRPRLATSASGASQIMTIRPWAESDGDPGYPKEVLGIAVMEHRLVRLDEPGALVTLEDGRYAFTGRLLGVGSASALQEAAKRRLARAESESELGWWREVVGELAR